MKFKRILSTLVFVVALFCSAKVMGQDVPKKYSIMISQGHARSDLGYRGMGHKTTFLVKQHKYFAYGAEFGFDILSLSGSYIGRHYNYTLNPAIYSYFIDNKKHQLYLGASIGLSVRSYRESATTNTSLGLNYSSNIGYNYKLSKSFLIGARVCSSNNMFNNNLYDTLSSSTSLLLTLGYTF